MKHEPTDAIDLEAVSNGLPASTTSRHYLTTTQSNHFRTRQRLIASAQSEMNGLFAYLIEENGLKPRPGYILDLSDDCSMIVEKPDPRLQMPQS